MENNNIKELCTVTLDGETRSSDDFVAVLSDETGNAHICYNTDALTLGMSMQLIIKAFARCLAQCSDEERNQIQDILAGAQIEETEECVDCE